jgi:hypothetical protein
VLRLPWKPWCETDLQLGMAVDLHDHLLCTCGCGQWEKDAHNPLLKDKWRVDEDVCYVRRTLDAYVKDHEPASEVQLNVRLDRDGTDGPEDEYAALLARHPSLTARQAHTPPDGDADDGSDEREQQ